MTRKTTDPSLCLFLELSTDPDRDVSAATAILTAVRPAALILCSPAETPRVQASTKDIINVCKTHEVAVLVQDDPDLAKDLQADGAHLTRSENPLEDLATARSKLGPDAIIGADAGPARHAAMELGEAGATYVAFGKSASADTGTQHQADQLSWWTQLFEIPALALDATGPDEIVALKQAGADLIAAHVPTSSTLDELTNWALKLDAAANQPVTAGEAVTTA